MSKALLLDEMVSLALENARRADRCANAAADYARGSGHAKIYAEATEACDHAASAALSAVRAVAECMLQNKKPEGRGRCGIDHLDVRADNDDECEFMDHQPIRCGDCEQFEPNSPKKPRGLCKKSGCFRSADLGGYCDLLGVVRVCGECTHFEPKRP